MISAGLSGTDLAVWPPNNASTTSLGRTSRRNTLLRYLAQAASADRLSDEDLRRVVMQTLSGGGERMMTIAEQWAQESRQEGRQEGLNSERQLVLRLVRRRFGAGAVEQSRILLERITEPTALDELGEMLLDCADGEAWLAALAWRAG